MLTIGVDTGGTFTDFVAFDGTQNLLRVAKTASTPADPTDAFMRGLQELDVDLERVDRIIHGTTIATNAVLEHKGARTAVIVTRGHRDIVELGQLRQYSENVLFNRFFQRPPPFVERNSRYEIAERIGPGGEVLKPIDEQELDAIVARLGADGIETVAVCLINSYANDRHERLIAEKIRAELPQISVSESMRVSPEFREFERWATTVLNAYVDKSVSSYLRRLNQRLRDADYKGELFYITSSGGIITAATAPDQPVRFLLSGPAAGIRAAVHLGRHAGFRNVITYDMGGTSTDISLIEDLDPIITHERQFAGTVIKTPQLDIVAIGAGGGSIAWLDGDGSLKVGPRSAGADPGPACYGRAGTEPTVTDANLLLGRIGEGAALGGAMRLDKSRAEAAIGRLAERLGLNDRFELAEGILEICNNNMAGAVRTVSVERGLDPRDFALMPMGGAGPMHAAGVAEDLRIASVLIPANPGNACANGLLATDLQHDYVRTCVTELGDADLGAIRALIGEMREEGARELVREGVARERIEVRCSADIRYVGQSFRLEVPITESSTLAELEQAFHDRYQKVYGYSRREKPAELVFVRAVAIGTVDKPAPDANGGAAANGHGEPKGIRAVYFTGRFRDCPIYDRGALPPGFSGCGPAVVEEYGSTTVVPPGWGVSVDELGNLRLSMSKEMQ